MTRGAISAGLEPALLHLLKLRASQLNGCAFCLDLHSRQARQEGETERRLHLLAAWRAAPLFTARERAALALAEAVTTLTGGQVPAGTYRQASELFSEPELAHLILAVTVINTWNRLAVTSNLGPAR